MRSAISDAGSSLLAFLPSLGTGELLAFGVENVHSLYLETLAELGVAGGALYVTTRTLLRACAGEDSRLARVIAGETFKAIRPSRS